MTKNGRAWADYSETFRRDVLPKIMSSAVSLQVYGGDGSDFDVRQATELGAMLLLGKPLILVATPGATIPAALRRAADVVIEDYVAGDPSYDDRLAAALRRITSDDV